MIKTMDDLIKDGEDFLQHHGVKGQKWGVQNGPPYPLGSDVSTGNRLIKKQAKLSSKADLAKKNKNFKKYERLVKRLNKINKKIEEKDRKQEEKEDILIRRENEKNAIKDYKTNKTTKPYKYVENLSDIVTVYDYKKLLETAGSKTVRRNILSDAINYAQESENRPLLNYYKNKFNKNEKTKDSIQRTLQSMVKEQDELQRNMGGLDPNSKRYKMYKKQIDRLDEEIWKIENSKKNKNKINHYDELKKDGDAFLEHHGIKGQKWGVRNGPPYPLGSDVSTGKRLKKSGSSKKDVKTGYVPLSVLLWGGSMALAGAAAVGKRFIRNKALKNINKEQENTVYKIDKKSGLKLKPREMSEKEDLKRVNPEHKTRFNRFDDAKTSNNCTNCTYAYELRRRGFEVRAEKLSSGRTDTKEVTAKIFKNAKFIDSSNISNPSKWTLLNAKDGLNYDVYREFKNKMKNEPPGSRGQIILRWDTYSGHSVNYKVNEKGKVEIHEAQSGRKRSAREYLTHSVSFSYARLDDKEINYKNLKKLDVVEGYNNKRELIVDLRTDDIKFKEKIAAKKGKKKS